MQFESKEYYTFDDVLIKPNFSDIETRESISTDVDFLGLKLRVPIISANMDFVTGSRMANAMWAAGGLGIIHRFCPWDAQIDNIANVQGKSPITLSIGTRNIKESVSRAFEANQLNATGIIQEEFVWPPTIICIDIAHGHHEKVAKLIHQIKNLKLNIKIIAGNVATAEGAWYLSDAGADAIKVGIGPGSVCTTRTVTGVGIPQLSAIMEVTDALRPYSIPVIADGGIKNSGDIVKALAAGASMVMLGSLLAGATECPGEVIETGDGRKLRRYRGQSIFGVNGEKYTKEGVSGYVPEKGPVADVLKQLVGGLKSGMSYVGARNLEELREKTAFIPVSGNTLAENQTRIAVSV